MTEESDERANAVIVALKNYLKSLAREYPELEYQVAIAVPEADGKGASCGFLMAENVPAGVMLSEAMRTACVRRSKANGVSDSMQQTMIAQGQRQGEKLAIELARLEAGG